MKIKIITLLVLCIIIMSFTQSQKAKFRPPGTVEIVDNFFFDETELTNLDWKEYLSYLKRYEQDQPELFQNALPDTSVWFTKDGYSEPFIDTYFQHPSYSDYPVVGISHQQAKAYCKWRTKAVKAMLKTNNIEGPKRFEYRLPTQTEWNLIASGGFDKKAKRILMKGKKRAEKSQNDFDKNNSNTWLQIFQEANMRYKNVDEKREKYFPNMGTSSDMITPSKTYLPNKYGVYNIYGNVAEMVEQEGIAMGGSYKDYYHDIVPMNKTLKYDKPARWLGFRCVCEIIEE